MQAGPASERGDRRRLVLLVVCLTASLALYVMLAIVLGSVPPGWDSTVGFSLASAPMFRAFTGLPAATLSPSGFTRALTAVLALLWGLWGAAVLALRGISTPAARRRARAIVLAGCALMLMLVIAWVPPLLSADLYRQAIYGRMVLHGINPYATVASAVPGEPLLAFANQVQVTTIYGPAYTWLSALTAALAPSGPLGAALGWKTMSALAALGCAALAGPVARTLAVDDGDGVEAQLWLGWSPLLVIEAAASGHIEPVMMLPALGGLLLLARTRTVRGILLLVVSILTKWVTGLLLLLAVARQLRRAPPGRRLRALLAIAVPGGLLAAILYAPFATGLINASGIHDLALHGAGSFGGASKSGPPEWAMIAGFAAVAGAVTVASWRANADWPALIATAAALMLAFILVVVPWLFPWYFIAPLALAAVLPAGRARFWLRFATVGLGAGVMLYYAKLIVAR